MINFHPDWATFTPKTREFINNYEFKTHREIAKGDGIVARLSNPSTMESRQYTLITERGTYRRQVGRMPRMDLQPEFERTLPTCIQLCHKQAEVFGWVWETVGGMSHIAERVIKSCNVYDWTEIEQACDEEINA